MSMVSAQQAAGIQPLMSINTAQAQGKYTNRKFNVKRTKIGRKRGRKSNKGLITLPDSDSDCKPNLEAEDEISMEY